MLNNSRIENEDYKAIFLKGKNYEIVRIRTKGKYCPKIKKYGEDFLLDFEDFSFIPADDSDKIIEGIMKAKTFIKKIESKKKEDE